MTASRVSDFRRSLEPLLDKGVLPGAIAVDLDDLWETSQKLCVLLEDLAARDAAWSTAELKSKLFEVQILIEQDLPMIFDDLVTPLRTLSGESLDRFSRTGPT